jgi:hypothetical protein
MLSRFLAFCLCAAAFGCSDQAVKQSTVRTVWRASTDNGDKPGNGIVLVEDGGRINGTFFLLDPNKPHNFKAGRAFPTEVVQAREGELRFVVRLGDNQKDEFAIVLQGPLTGKRVNATLRDILGERNPTALTFVRE